MRHLVLAGCCVCLATLSGSAPAADGEKPLEPVRSFEVRAGRAFYLNGKPFFPLMAWLQDPKNFPLLRECGMNATAGYWRSSGGTKNAREYLDLVAAAGLYGIMPFDAALKDHPALLAYIHDDEPDLPTQVSDARIEPGKQLRINRRTPLWKLLDGDLTSWSVLDPLEGASLTIQLKEPVTAVSLAVHVTVSKGLAMPKEVAFEADGTEILRATLAPQRGRQKFDLPRPATFRNLTFKVLSITPGDNEWGSLGEIEAFDRDGRNVLLAPPRMVSRSTPEKTMEHYRQIKSADPSRPVFMTLTANFHPHFKKWPEDQRQPLYRAFIAAADVVGYDVYPIYGWNRPDWIHLCSECTRLLADLAGEKPVYAWIETSKGGQWTGDLDRQKDVTPVHIRAEVWMSICRGATAIGYFTHIWKPSYSQFGVPEENRRALRQINDQIARLTPAILGAPAKRSVKIESDGAKLDVMAREHDGELYLFTVNYDERMKGAKASVRVEGLTAGTVVTVVDEQRTLRASDGFFEDDFAPLAVHIYRLGR